MLPKKFLERMQWMLGEEYGAFLDSFEEERYQALRLNSLKKGMDGCSGAETLGLKGQEFAHLTQVSWAENGYYYQAEDQPGKHPYHEAGLYYIQEPSAMAPAELLEVQPGERVLDLCAAPGGKSTQIGAKLQGKGLLLCNEINPSRAKILSENIERMGIVNACVTNETPERLAEFFPEYFDCILVDAPCSGEGMFRKNDVACEEWSPENVIMCAGRQDGILDCAARMLRPGGRLVYSTCTFASEENEGSVGRFLQRHRDFELLPIEKEKPGLTGCDGRSEWFSESLTENGSRRGLEGTLRLWPHKVKGEGHFTALMRRVGDGSLYRASYGTGKGLSEKELGESGVLEELKRFCRETLRLPAADGDAGQRGEKGSTRGYKAEGGISGKKKRTMPGKQEDTLAGRLGSVLGLGEETVWVRFGENLYLAPAEMPSLKGLRVLRPGLHIGEIKKNRFEPSHALAMALPPEIAVHKWNLSSDSREILDYLGGGTFSAEGEKGWYLVCVDGFGTGWGKLAGGIMKNHYPKGLRKNR